jgi:hypothetical protein
VKQIARNRRLPELALTSWNETIAQVEHVIARGWRDTVTPLTRANDDDCLELSSTPDSDARADPT